MRCGILGLVLSALTFSVSYAFVEYYEIRDTTFGYNPVLFSLVYPYHFVMAAVFGLAAYGLLSAHVGTKGSRFLSYYDQMKELLPVGIEENLADEYYHLST